jgi:hypothetical protein
VACQHGSASRQLPTQAELLDAGRSDIVRAIGMHGGSAAVAERLGVGVRQGCVRVRARSRRIQFVLFGDGQIGSSFQ